MDSHRVSLYPAVKTQDTWRSYAGSLLIGASLTSELKLSNYAGTGWSELTIFYDSVLHRYKQALNLLRYTELMLPCEALAWYFQNHDNAMCVVHHNQQHVPSKAVCREISPALWKISSTDSEKISKKVVFFFFLNFFAFFFFFLNNLANFEPKLTILAQEPL